MRNAGNAKRDEKLGTRLNGIPPNAPCHPLSRLSVTSESSPSSSFSNGFRFSGDASAYSAPFFHGKHQPPSDHYSTKSWLGSDFYMGNENINFNGDDEWGDDLGLGLSEEFSRMSIVDRQGNIGSKTRGYDYDMDSSYTCSLDANVPYISPCRHIDTRKEVRPNHEGMVANSSSSWGVSPSLAADMKWALPNSGKGYTFGTPLESSFDRDQSGGASYSGSGWKSTQMYHHMMDHGKKQGINGCECDAEVQLQKPSFTTHVPYLCDRFMCSQPFGMDCDAGMSVKNPLRFSQTMQPKRALNLDSPSHFSPRGVGGDPVAFKCDNSFIIQGKGVKYCLDNGCNSLGLSDCKNNSHDEVTNIQIEGERVPRHISHTPGTQICESNGTLASDFSRSLLLSFYSLAEVQGYVYHLAKDQNGCRFLQRVVDEGTSEDMQIVFEGIIDNVVELMMDPFGNYLVQKLLDVCREDQRLQIVIMLTKEPVQLVRTSLNTHGTRVVQKLIETLKSRKQISLVRSAIQPGFLDLIKDLNGNHVIQRCLQCLSCQDNEFIFDAAANFCVDIATHRHGCCVLQRCIDHSMGNYQNKLVTEICRHALLLAQDPFGNYVVQYIIELEVPTTTTKLIAQFKGNYVNLSTQKFSSHVVEKCLKHVGESRSMIVRELLSAPHFDQLLQDPYANHVIQSALAVTKGSLHVSLAEAVRPHRILRTSPYCKRVFSVSLL